jgi:hypothetical protein
MANQFTKGTRTKHDESTKDRIRAEHLARRLFNFAKAKGDKAKKLSMDSNQVAAARVLIERGKPALQAIEQTQVNEYDRMTEEEMEDLIRALITSNPGLIERLGIRPQLVSPQTADPAAHNTHDIRTEAA